MDTLTPSPIGHNHPPPYDPDKLAELSATVESFMGQSTKIRNEFAPIQTEAHAALLTDHIAGLRGLAKKVDAARADAKKPHDDAGKAVQAAFKPLLDRLERATGIMLDLSNDYLTRKRQEEAKRRAEEQAEADRLRAEAEAKAKAAAESGDLSAEVEAEEAAKAADEAQELAGREVKASVRSATGAGRTISQREVRTVEIENIRVLFLRLQAAPEVAEVLQRLANAHVRAKDWDGKDLPGTRTVTKHVAV